MTIIKASFILFLLAICSAVSGEDCIDTEGICNKDKSIKTLGISKKGLTCIPDCIGSLTALSSLWSCLLKNNYNYNTCLHITETFTEII